MDFVSMPIIVLICYVIGEVYKILFKSKQEAYKLIPVLVAIVGGVLGVAIYLTTPELLFNVNNPWIALGIGIMSGFSATGTNQVFKQFKKLKKLCCTHNYKKFTNRRIV